MTGQSSKQIPVVDIASLLPDSKSDEASRAAAIQQLIQSCHEQGCVGIRGYGISPEKLTEAFDYMHKLFALPMEDKMKAPHPGSMTPNRGYSPPGLEKAYSKADMENGDEESRKARRQVIDYKEIFAVGSEENKVDYNIWLPEDVLPGFRSFETELYWELRQLSVIILDAFCTGLNLTEAERAYVHSLHSGHGNQLRSLHYLPIPEARVGDEKIGRLPAHTDFTTFTLLFQDSCGGLEFEDRAHEGTFMHAVPLEDTLYLNVGDSLTRLSNDYLPASNHRVSVPQQLVSLSGQEGSFAPPRYSMPYFVTPDNEAFIEPQATCIKATTGKPEYEGTSLLDYKKWRMQLFFADDPKTSD